MAMDFGRSDDHIGGKETSAASEYRRDTHPLPEEVSP